MPHKNVILSNGIAASQAASLPSARRGASQTASHKRHKIRCESGRKWGLHIVRRNGIFHFRRRWPAPLVVLGAPQFLSVSLRTEFLSIATNRAAALRMALDEGEQDVLDALSESELKETDIAAVLKDMVRTATQRMLQEQEAPSPEFDEADRLTSIETALEEIKDALKARDWSAGLSLAPEGARQDPELANKPKDARRVLQTQRHLLRLEQQVIETMDDRLILGAQLLKDHGIAPTREGLAPPMLLSEAIERAADDAALHSQRKIEVTGRLMLSYFGDIAVETLTYSKVMAFLEAVWWLPKGWGKSHGKNRYNKDGKDICPFEERRLADAVDAHVMDRILNDDTLTNPDRRRELMGNLIPRQTDANVVNHRAFAQSILKAGLGSARVGRDIDDDKRIIPNERMLKKEITKWHKKAETECGLPRRRTDPKRRRSWSTEHLAKFLTSPIYSGSTSAKQRGRPAKGRRPVIVRDALYWVPLIMLTMGVRPEEILQLPISGVIIRDGILCLSFEDNTKNEQSKRILPVPNILLELGFREWVVHKRKDGETWLFPEISEDANHKRKSQSFGDRLRNILRTLNIICPNEDVYAMRRTLSSRLHNSGVDLGVRKRILGHIEGTTIDRHYSDDGLHELKAVLDQVDYGIKIGKTSQFGFPLIVGCSTSILPSAALVIALQANGQVAAFCICSAETDEVLLEARMAGARLPEKHRLSNAAVCSLEEGANRFLKITRTHDVLIPGGLKETHAVEHLLIYADDVDAKKAAGPSRFEENHTRCESDGEIEEETSLEEPKSVGPETVRVAQTVLCRFPLFGRSAKSGKMRPGLIVGTKTPGNGTFLDIACGPPAIECDVQPWDLVVNDPTAMDCARLKLPTVFNMRRRILVDTDEVPVLGGSLGKLNADSEKRMLDCISFAGDVSPQLIDHAKHRAHGNVVVEVRRTKLPRR